MTDSTAPIRLLFASVGDDPFIAQVANHLAAAVRERGGEMLCVEPGRRPIEIAHRLACPAVYVEEADLGGRCDADSSDLQSQLVNIIEDTKWFARVSGPPEDASTVTRDLSTAARAIDETLDVFKPHAVIVWNGMLSVRAVVADRARRRRISVWCGEKGLLPGSWYVDPVGVNGASSLVTDPLNADLAARLAKPLGPAERQAVLDELDAIARQGASAWGQAALVGPDVWRERLDLAADRPVLFFPLQVDADTNMRFFSPHFAGNLRALRAVAAAVRGSDWFLLVKPHPKGSYPLGEIERIIGPQGCCANDINVHDALSLASLVVTINSTVAAEAAWHGLPVLQLGRGILSGQRIVAEYEPSQPLAEQVLRAAREWTADPQRHERALAFYWYMSRHYLRFIEKPEDAAKVVDLVSRDCPASSGLTLSRWPTAREVAARFIWQPAVDLLRALRQRDPQPRRVILMGYGLNARHLLAALERAGAFDPWEWCVWDDRPLAREHAHQDGLVLAQPARDRQRSCEELVIVTPDRSRAIIEQLERFGKQAGRDYILLRPEHAQSTEPVALG